MILIIARWSVAVLLIAFAVRRKSLTSWIFASMALGLNVGCDFPDIAVKLDVLSQIFLRLIKTIIAPLLLSTLVVGIAGHSNIKQVGRMGLKALIYFEIVTTLALFIGLAAINITKAGEGIDLSLAAGQHETVNAAKKTAKDIIVHSFPENIAKAVANGEILQIVVFSVLLGIGLSLASEKNKAFLLGCFEGLSEAMFKFTNIVMYFAPVAVGSAIAVVIGKNGAGILVNMAQLVGTLYGALFVFIALVLFPIALIAKVPIKRFLKSAIEPVSIAFATSSSEAALPRAMEEMEAFGVPRKVVSFVIPTGYSFNLDGSAIYLSLTSIFVAQAAGIYLSIGQQLMIVFTLMLTSKGVAGVSRASLVILMGTVASFGLPIEPVIIVLGIDAIMDMARTAVNVLGNCLATVVIARWEGECLDVSKV